MGVAEKISIEKRHTAKLSLDGEDWSLFTASMDCAKVAAALNEAFEKGVADTNGRAGTRRAVVAVMTSFADYGANDTEPRDMLEELLDRVFGSMLCR